MPGIRKAVVGDQAGSSVHGPQVETSLLDFEAVGVQFATGFKDLEVRVFVDEPQVVLDEENHLFLVHLK